MTRAKNIDDLARAAGFTAMQRNSFYNQERFTRFAALVRAQALEDAAVKCESVGGMGGDYWTDQCAAAIRGMR